MVGQREFFLRRLRRFLWALDEEAPVVAKSATWAEPESLASENSPAARSPEISFPKNRSARLLRNLLVLLIRVVSKPNDLLDHI